MISAATVPRKMVNLMPRFKREMYSIVDWRRLSSGLSRTFTRAIILFIRRRYMALYKFWNNRVHRVQRNSSGSGRTHIQNTISDAG